MIQFFRIDDRLIHGQIATTWTRHICPSRIVVADDKTAASPMLTSLQRMSAPKDFELSVLPVRDAITKLQGDFLMEKIFLLTGSVKDAYQIAMNCDVSELNVGNVGYKEGTVKLINRIYVFPEDLELLGKIVKKGVRVYAQMLPNESVDLLSDEVLTAVEKAAGKQ